jgi:ABC-type branched-subunit amino acid transport system ATPase component
MSKVVFHSKQFNIEGIQIPEFSLSKGELIRIYIPNFNSSKNKLGFDLTIQLVKHFQNFPWAKNYSQNILYEFIKSLTVRRYLINKMDIEEKKVVEICQLLKINQTCRLNLLSHTKRKALIITALFANNDIILLDYYGVDQQSLKYLEEIINIEIEKGKSAIGFDNLEFDEGIEPYNNISPIKIKSN